ncbi:MAG: TIGR02646 family protein [Verrucomicrobia bacterium]|nr:MAG: TIGR02646 family protein [Verrucomicrobiota bacterium]
MHFLDRSTVDEPGCLADWSYPDMNWDDFTEDGAACKRLLRLALQRLQSQQIIDDQADDEIEYLLGLRCAYCEGQIYHGGHIEHFRRKNQKHFPHLTFDWNNLFLACGSKDHCGHYKDRPKAPAYNPDELIKPDEHNPDDFLYFHSSGEVRVRHRPGMTDADHGRATETIRVFNLNCKSLKGARRKALKQYLDSSNGILEDLMVFEPQDQRDFIAHEIEATKHDPYWTTIRHFFEKLPA